MLHELRRLVADKSVAVVGNSEAILARADGTLIDGHDLVLRMNLGIPDCGAGKVRIGRTAVGYRTDIWATARYWPNVLPPECAAIVWMKLTKLGKQELASLQGSNPHCPVWLWPHELEREVRAFVGADPGTGIRILYWLARYAYPKSVTLFGMDCWQHNTHWSGQKATCNHKPDLEMLALKRLGY
jgi:hypothetical protein